MIVFRGICSHRGLGSQSLTGGEDDSPPDDLSWLLARVGRRLPVLRSLGLARCPRTGLHWLQKESWAGILEHVQHLANTSVHGEACVSQDSLVTLFAKFPSKGLVTSQRNGSQTNHDPGCSAHLLQEPPCMVGVHLPFVVILITFDSHLYIYMYFK